MNPLPKAVGLVATIVAGIGAVSAILKDPVVHDLVQAFVTQHPDLAVVFSGVVAIVAALSHSLTGDGGKR